MDETKVASTQSHLSQFVEGFKEVLGRSERRHWCQIYLSGLLMDGERKSIQAMANRLPPGNEQALQQFIDQSPPGLPMKFN